MPEASRFGLLTTCIQAVQRLLFPSRPAQSHHEYLPSTLPVRVHDDERLARFLKQRNQFSREKRIAKYAAFLPARDGHTSVFRHPAEPAEALWHIAASALGEEITVYGAAIVVASEIRATQLEVTASEPPPRHANIEGWPMHDDPVLTKAARMEIAKVIAERAKLVLRPQ